MTTIKCGKKRVVQIKGLKEIGGEVLSTIGKICIKGDQKERKKL